MIKQEYKKLFQSVELLGSSKDQQINYLKTLGTYPSTDELALEFDDSYMMYKGLVSEGKLAELTSIGAELERIDYLLKVISESSNKNLWLVESLESTLWNELRDSARRILVEAKLY